MMTLTKLKAGKSAKPYTEPVKVNVCGVGSASNYTTDKGEDKQTVVVGVADKDTVMKVVVYDDNKLVSMTVGNAVMLTNYIFKTTPEPQIIITAKSKVMRTASIAVKDELREVAARIAHPPPAATVPLGQVKLSPVKSLVSVKGKIVSEEIAKTVQVRGTDVTVKTVTVKSGEEQINLTLWRDLAARSLMGQFLQIDNVVVNSYRNEVSLNTTARTKIETCDEPTTSVTGTLIGFECQELTVSLMVEVSETFPSFDISKATVLQALDVTDADIEDELMNRIPTAITLAVRDGNAETITFEGDK